MIWFEESKASSSIYLYFSDDPQAGANEIASGACSRQTLLRRPTDHAKNAPQLRQLRLSI